MTAAPTVILTRAPEDNVALARRLRAHGLAVLEWPALTTRPVAPGRADEPLAARLARAQVVVVTSRRGLESAEAALGSDGPLARHLSGRLACVGPATAAAAVSLGLEPALTASGTGSEELARRLSGEPAGTRVLLLRSAAADDALPRALEAAGLVVDDARLYEPAEPERPEAEPMPVAAVACASPSAARMLLQWHPWLAACPFVAIGHTTAEALRGLGVGHVEVAAAPDDAALEDAILHLARTGAKAPGHLARAGEKPPGENRS